MSYVEDLAVAYEQKYGERPSEMTLKVAQHIEKVSWMLRDLGWENARNGEKSLLDEVSPALVRKVFRLDPDEDDAVVFDVADLWREAYQKGYKKGGVPIEVIDKCDCIC